MDTSRDMTTKRALIVVGVVLFLVLFSLVLPAKWLGITPKKTRSPLVLKTTHQLRTLSDDTDNNSSPDWRDLVLENFNNVSPEAKAAVNDASKARIEDPNNLTASFSKNLYVAASYSQKNTSSPKDQQEMLRTVISEESKKILPHIYEVNDLNVAESSSPEIIKAYGNNLGLILKKAVSLKITNDDMEIIKTYYATKDSTVLSSLAVKKNNIEAILQELNNIKVPFSATPYHLATLNAISEYKTIIENLSQGEQDPLRALIAFNNYMSVIQNMRGAFEGISLYFQLQNITYSQNEPGYLILTGYTSNK